MTRRDARRIVYEATGCVVSVHYSSHAGGYTVEISRDHGNWRETVRTSSINLDTAIKALVQRCELTVFFGRSRSLLEKLIAAQTKSDDVRRLKLRQLHAHLTGAVPLLESLIEDLRGPSFFELRKQAASVAELRRAA